ncbi:putative baseplate-J protein [Psychrobacillus phage PVJ1]|nr:putative baseplate-J protein [Psychrobacillus phage PVJ1]
MSFEDIMKCFLSIYPLDLDKREGSVIWDLIAPKAISIQNEYPNITPEQILKMIDFDEIKRFTSLARMPSTY